MVVVAGPNGSGKSTATRQLRLTETMPVIDPDAIARTISPSDVTAAALAAGRKALSLAEAYLKSQVTFGVESTLAGKGPLARMAEARSRGFEVQLYYVAVDTCELSIERVRSRVRLGGHGIPEHEIRRRYSRSLDNVVKAIAFAHRATLLDNSSFRMSTIAEFHHATLTWQAPKVPDWAVSVLPHFPRSAPL